MSGSGERPPPPAPGAYPYGILYVLPFAPPPPPAGSSHGTTPGPAYPPPVWPYPAGYPVAAPTDREADRVASAAAAPTAKSAAASRSATPHAQTPHNHTPGVRSPTLVPQAASGPPPTVPALDASEAMVAPEATDGHFLRELKRLVHKIESIKPAVAAQRRPASAAAASSTSHGTAAPALHVNNFTTGAGAAPRKGSLQSTLEYLKANRPPPLTLEAALQRVRVFDL